MTDRPTTDARAGQSASTSQSRQGLGSRIRRSLGRLASTQDDLEAEELQEGVRRAGCTPVSQCGDRQKVMLAGTLRSVTLRPRGGSPALEAELYDGSGTVTVVWLGRRRIAGVQPGRGIVVEGRISWQDGERVLFNPGYELEAASR